MISHFEAFSKIELNLEIICNLFTFVRINYMNLVV